MLRRELMRRLRNVEFNWTLIVCIVVLIVYLCLFTNLPTSAKQTRTVSQDPNTIRWVASPQDANTPPADPNIPKLARQTLSGQILPTGEDWAKYFDTTPRDTVQVHYNLWVFLNVLRLQEAQIKQLTERVAALENKLEPVVFPSVTPVVK